jgi:hypothetical protein
MVNGILFGEIADDAIATAMGYRLLSNWLAYAATAGIHEFLSPTSVDPPYPLSLFVARVATERM